MRLTDVIVAVYDAAVPETRKIYALHDLQIGFAAFSGTIAFDSIQLVEIWLADIIVQVTLPENVLGRGTGIVACLAFALVIFD